ncbi:DUF3870 domain-containing protein [Brevibacillus daliensis]|uniref:DUF3870 domain-containing protein n=1 Tax=Brevibacillus daliensis TaxID=2892995 RepID=UPI001E56894A|nr:DUF3870 domain-containing protein [Brevibacillus daliensis]
MENQTPAPRYAADKYVLATGFAQLPKGTPLTDTQKMFACSLVIDSTTDGVVDASFSFIMGLNEEFLRGLVIGTTLPRDFDLLQKRVKERALVPTQGTILQALRSTLDRYLERTTKQ